MARPAILRLLVLLATLPACSPAPPLDPENGDPDSVILTRANHPSGYGDLNCFNTACHANGAANFAPDAEVHILPELSCVATSCHGVNGVLDRALITGRVFADVSGGEAEQGVVVRAEETGNPEVSYDSNETGTYGFFALTIPLSGTYDFVLVDRNEVRTSSLDSPMGSLTISGGYTGSSDCSACHGRTDPVLHPIR